MNHYHFKNTNLIKKMRLHCKMIADAQNSNGSSGMSKYNLEGTITLSSDDSNTCCNFS